MADLDDRPWLIDARSGAVTTYAELLRALDDPEARLRPLLRPANTREALLEVTRALLAGAELTLFDADFGPRKLSELGYSEGQVNRLGPTGRRRSAAAADLWGLVVAATDARLNLFTSGSTGLPKVVSHSLATLARGVKVSDRHAADIWALAFNPTHMAGLQVYLQALANANPLVDVYGCDRAKVLEALARHGVTHIAATPTFYRLLLPVDAPVSSVRSVTFGGESSDGALRARLTQLFPAARFHNIYASTEAGSLLVADGDVFTIPPKLAGLVRLHDGTLHVHVSLLGEFQRSAGMAGLWFDTGDVVEEVSTEPLGFRIVARKTDLVNVGGNKVNPHEVEAVLEEFTGVVKARVFGRENSVVGQVLCAEVTCAGSPPTERALREFAGVRLQPCKVPRVITFTDQPAQTRSGKLQRP